jgi:hypothetical protein
MEPLLANGEYVKYQLRRRQMALLGTYWARVVGSRVDKKGRRLYTFRMIEPWYNEGERYQIDVPESELVNVQHTDRTPFPEQNEKNEDDEAQARAQKEKEPDEYRGRRYLHNLGLTMMGQPATSAADSSSDDEEEEHASEYVFKPPPPPHPDANPRYIIDVGKFVKFEGDKLAFVQEKHKDAQGMWVYRIQMIRPGAGQVLDLPASYFVSRLDMVFAADEQNEAEDLTEDSRRFMERRRSNELSRPTDGNGNFLPRDYKIR